MHTTKHIRRDFVRVYVCRAVTFGLDFCEKPTAPQSESRDSTSEINEILRNKVNVLCANSPCGPKKVDLRTHIINFADLSTSTFLPPSFPLATQRRAERLMARHHPHPIAAMARAVIVVMLLVVVLVPAAATSGSCLLYTSPSPRDGLLSRMPSSA